MRGLTRRSSFTIAVLCGLPSLIAQNVPDVARRISELETQTQQRLQEQKPKLAIPLLREIVSLDSKNMNAQANLGVLLFFDGQYPEAIPHMREALQGQPELSRIQALLGIAEKRTGDAAGAQNDLASSFLKLTDPKVRVQAGLELIELYLATSQLNRAQSVAATLTELEPENPQILLVAHQISKQMMDQTLLSLMLAAPESAEMHMVSAGELARQGDRANAIAHYREAIRLKPSIPGAHFQLAEQLRSSPDPSLNAQAEEQYTQALRANQYDELSWRQLAGILEAKGDLKGAEANYRKALALQPTDSEAETGLAIALIPANRTEEAISLLQSAVKHDPSNLVAHFRLSTLYRRGGRIAESDREMETFHHYQDIKDKLGRTFKQFAGRATQ